MKKREFIEQSISPELAKAVIEQSGGWDHFKEYAPDIANHGIDGGFNGFIYYTDTVKFAEDNKQEILKLAEEQAKDIGLSGALEMIAGFNCLNGDYSQTQVAEGIYFNDTDNDQTIRNALAWYAGEEIARNYADLVEV